MLFLYFIFVHLVLLIPGFGFVYNARFLRSKPSLQLCAAYMLDIAFLAGVAIAGYVFDIERYWLHSVAWVFIALGTYFFIKHRLYKALWVQRFPLLALSAISLFSLAFIGLQLSGPQQMFPDPKYRIDHNYQAFNVKVLNVAQTNANDNYVPYRQAQFMINRSDPAKDSFIDEWGVHFFQRTPLLGAVTAQFFTLFGDTPPIGYTWGPGVQDSANTYGKFQVVAHIMNALFIVPAFFLISRLFNRRTAQVAVLFIVPSHFFLYNAFFSWPKSLVAFFILFSWLLLFEKRMKYVVLAGAASGIAYLAHDLAILYIAASALLLLHWRRIRDLFIFIGMHLFFFLPWFITSAFIYHKPSTFMYYPFSLHEIPQVDQKDAIIREFFHTSPLKILWIKIQFLFYLLSPYQLFFSEGGKEIGNRLWAASLFNLSGAVGFGLMIPAFLGALQRLRRNLTFWILALVPILMCVLLIGWPKGLGALHFAQASVVLFIGLAISFLLARKHLIWLWIAFLINIAQLVYFGIFSYDFRLGAWMNAHDISLIVIMLGTIAGCAFGIHIAAAKRQL